MFCSWTLGSLRAWGLRPPLDLGLFLGDLIGSGPLSSISPAWRHLEGCVPVKGLSGVSWFSALVSAGQGQRGTQHASLGLRSGQGRPSPSGCRTPGQDFSLSLAAVTLQRFGWKRAAGYEADFWAKWVNGFVRMIPDDRHMGVMGEMGSSRLLAAGEAGSEAGPLWGGGKGRNFCLVPEGSRQKHPLNTQPAAQGARGLPAV